MCTLDRIERFKMSDAYDFMAYFDTDGPNYSFAAPNLTANDLATYSNFVRAVLRSSGRVWQHPDFQDKKKPTGEWLSFVDKLLVTPRIPQWPFS